jgi:hypothetical protein
MGAKPTSRSPAAESRALHALQGRGLARRIAGARRHGSIAKLQRYQQGDFNRAIHYGPSGVARAGEPPPPQSGKTMRWGRTGYGARAAAVTQADVARNGLQMK